MSNINDINNKIDEMKNFSLISSIQKVIKNKQSFHIEYEKVIDKYIDENKKLYEDLKKI